MTPPAQFVLQHTYSVSISRLHATTAALRSFFRYLLQKGELQPDLAASAPRVCEVLPILQTEIRPS